MCYYYYVRCDFSRQFLTMHFKIFKFWLERSKFGSNDIFTGNAIFLKQLKEKLEEKDIPQI